MSFSSRAGPRVNKTQANHGRQLEMQAGELQGQGCGDVSCHTKPVSWHLVYVSVFFSGQAGKHRQLGMKINLGLKKSVSFSVAF